MDSQINEVAIPAERRSVPSIGQIGRVSTEMAPKTKTTPGVANSCKLFYVNGPRRTDHSVSCRCALFRSTAPCANRKLTGRVMSKKEAEIRLLMGCVEWNPGPPKTCNHCGVVTDDIIGHLKSAHPRDGAGGKRRDAKGQSGGGKQDVVAKALQDAQKNATDLIKGAQDAANELIKQAKDKVEDLRRPGSDAKIELENLRANEDLDLYKQQRSSTDTLGKFKAGPVKARLFKTEDVSLPQDKPADGVLVVGDLRRNEIPHKLYAAAWWTKFWTILGLNLVLFMVMGYVNCWMKGIEVTVAPLDKAPFHLIRDVIFHTYRGDYLPNGSLGWIWWILYVLLSLLLDAAVLGAQVVITTCIILWNSPYVQMVKFVADLIILEASGNRWGVIWKIATAVVSSMTTGMLFMIITGSILKGGYKLIRYIAPYMYFFTEWRFWKKLSNYPPTFEEYMKLPMEKLIHMRLVLVPVSSIVQSVDHRPEMDRGDRLANTQFVKYQVAVEVKTDTGYRYYRNWVKTLNSHWYKSSGLSLKKVVLNSGLMATALNRKTMLASRDHPEVALDTMLRLISANSHYQEDYMELYQDGRSVYRDMALVCGAIVTRDVYLDNQHF